MFRRDARVELRLWPDRRSFHKQDREPFIPHKLIDAPTPWRARSPEVRIDQTEQFVVHGVGFFFFGGAQRFGSAMMKMILHQIAGHSAQRFLHGGDLHDDVAAVAIVAYHFLQAAHLAFNAAETLLIALFERGVDRGGFIAWADDTGTLGRVCVGGCFGWHSLSNTP